MEPTTIQLSDIRELDRQRQSYTNIPALALSILRAGILQPIVLRQDNVLIAGGRRKTALQTILNQDLDDEFKLPWSEIHPTIQEFIQTGQLKIGQECRYVVVTDNATLDELELIENAEREELTWQEHCLAIDKIHRNHAQKAGIEGKPWAQMDTAKLLKQTSRASVSHALRVAKFLKKNDAEMWKAKNMYEAFKLITARRTDEATREQAERNLNTMASPLSEFKVVDQPKFAEADGEVNIEDVANELFPAMPPNVSPELTDFGPSEPDGLITPEPEKPVMELPFSDRFVRGKFEEVFKRKSACVDHIITDPPYAIEMSNLAQANEGMVNIDAVADEHNVEQNLADMPIWLETAYRVLRPGGFCIMWCDFTHWYWLCQTAESVGFNAQRWPLIWNKTHNCKNQSPDKNFTKTAECAVVLRKDRQAVLVKPQHACVWTGSNEPERKLLAGHPFVKPFGLWQWCAKAVAIKGQTILDPFVGYGSMPIANIPEGYNILGCELKEQHYTVLRDNLADHCYSKVYPNNTIKLV